MKQVRSWILTFITTDFKRSQSGTRTTKFDYYRNLKLASMKQTKGRNSTSRKMLYMILVDSLLNAHQKRTSNLFSDTPVLVN